MKRNIYHITNHGSVECLKHSLIQAHKRLVTAGNYEAANYVYELLANRLVRLTGQESSYHGGKLNKRIYNAGGVALAELKRLRITGKQSNSGKSYLFTY